MVSQQKAGSNVLQMHDCEFSEFTCARAKLYQKWPDSHFFLGIFTFERGL